MHLKLGTTPLHKQKAPSASPIAAEALFLAEDHQKLAIMLLNLLLVKSNLV